MLGWDNRAAARASRRTRPRRSGSRARSALSNLTATGRPSTSSYPRQTTDIPPAPSRSTSRYRPASVSTTPTSVPHAGNGVVSGQPEPVKESAQFGRGTGEFVRGPAGGRGAGGGPVRLGRHLLGGPRDPLRRPDHAGQAAVHLAGGRGLLLDSR